MLELPTVQSATQGTRGAAATDKNATDNAKAETARNEFEAEYNDVNVEENARNSVSEDAPDTSRESEPEVAEPKPEASFEELTAPVGKDDSIPAEGKADDAIEPSLGAVEGVKKPEPEAKTPGTGPAFETGRAPEAEKRINPAQHATEVSDTAKAKATMPEADTANDKKVAQTNSTTAENVVLTKAADAAGQRPVRAEEKPAPSGKERVEVVPTARAADVTVKGQQAVATAQQKDTPLSVTQEKSLRQQAQETSEHREPPIRESAETSRKAVAQLQTPAANMVFSNTAAQSRQFVLQDKKDNLNLVPADFDLAGLTDTRTTTQSSTATINQVLQRAETPAMIARQMAEALQRLPDRPVEISLNPKELGRVRMNISAVEAGITVNVIAERPETLDLMRRNIEQLAREFEMIGYSDISFAFTEGETQQDFSEENQDSSDRSFTYLDLESAEMSTPPPESNHVTTGIDIRL